METPHSEAAGAEPRNQTHHVTHQATTKIQITGRCELQLQVSPAPFIYDITNVQLLHWLAVTQ